MKILHAALLLVLTGVAFSCGAQIAEDKADGQSHWLTACEVDAECGSSLCICGVCTSECESDAQCWENGGDMSSRCAAAETLDCRGLPAASSLCVPDCAGDACISSASESSTVEESATRLSFDTHSVPACPAESSNSLPVANDVSSESGHYEGMVTVDAIQTVAGFTRATVVFDELVGGQATLSGSLNLAQGQRFNALVESGGESNTRYAFIALRDDDGVLQLAIASGGDALYQSGLFQTKDAFGATLQLRMVCQENVDDGCFENQVQATYEGVFSGDAEVVTQGASHETLVIDGRSYLLSFHGSSVDGGAPTPDCTHLTTGRYIAFAVLPQ